MPDLPLPEDDAALYVMDGLTATERRDFETRLADSATLRALVRELEEGAQALALASPKRQPPPQVWKRIEKAVAEEAKRERVVSVFWSNLWRNGWAAAAACLVGWILYAVWIQQTGPAAPPAIASSKGHTKQPETALADSFPTNARETITPQTTTEVNAAQQLLQVRTQELGALRQQVAGLENRLTSLSQSLTQQQALLNESNRLKFFHLGPISNASGVASKATLSPALQRAVFLAMARELGWLPTGTAASGMGGVAASDSGPSNQMDVDFVDMRPGTNRVTNPFQSQPKVQTEISETVQPKMPGERADTSVPLPSPSRSITPGGIVPVIVSGDNLIVAVDPAIASSGSQLTFWDGTGSQEPLGSTTLGNNPLVVTFSSLNFSPAGGWNGSTLFITTTSLSGQSNVFQFATPETPNP